MIKCKKSKSEHLTSSSYKQLLLESAAEKATGENKKRSRAEKKATKHLQSGQIKAKTGQGKTKSKGQGKGKKTKPSQETDEDDCFSTDCYEAYGVTSNEG